MIVGGRDVQIGYVAALKGRLRAERSARFARTLAADPWWHALAARLDSLAWVYQLEQDYAMDSPTERWRWLHSRECAAIADE